MAGSENVAPVVSKMFCSPSVTTLVIRRRPHVVNGGGFVVSDCNQTVAFTVDGCGILGAKGELIVRDSDGASILIIQKKGGVIQLISTCNRWNGYQTYYEGGRQTVFSLCDPKPCFAQRKAMRISLEPRRMNKDWDFEVIGSFPERDCAIRTRSGVVAAQIGLKEMKGSKDVYFVVVQPGYDQAFVVGVIAVLDNIYGESTSC